MSAINVIMLEYISKLGKTGDVLKVKRGYFRNFLFPNGKAVYASKENLEIFEERKADLQKRDADRLSKAKTLYDRINGERIVINSAADVDGRLYGSVSQREVVEAINDRIKSLGADDIVSQSECILEEKIKEIGDHDITIELHPDVKAGVRVSVRHLSKGGQQLEEGSE